MESITIALVLLLAVVLSGTLARLSPVGIPLPLVQIALGAAIAGVTGSAVQLDPDFFFLLFLPPLLFLDGWRIPKEGLFRDKAVILELALGLVVFTVILIGFLVHWMIPAIPLAVAFALAAILSPTDPIAVSAIAARVPIPGRLMHILEGESLLNDASGLVCMQFAVAAVLTGVFSLADAVGTFLWVAIGGILIGFGTTFVVMKAKYYVSRKLGEEPGAQILISLLIPFGAYLLAEHLHCSGILAAVAAGITMSFAELRGQTMAATRMRRYAVWDTVQFALNGIIFVLLGEQMPGIVSGAARIVTETGHLHPIWLIAYVAVITTALAALRFAWVWVSLRFTLYRAARRGEAIRKPHWRLLAAMSLAGVRGAITLAGILTLPLAMNDGTSFPARDLVIFLAAGVIILSLTAASIGLPYLLQNLELPPEPDHLQEEDIARIAAAEAAIRMIEKLQHAMSEGRTDADLYGEVGTRLMELYRQRIEGRSKLGDEAELLRKMEEVDKRFRLAALRAERDELFRLGRRRKISEEIARKLVREIDLAEARYGF
ncbi:MULTISPECIES: Na+/H+ antiporter [Rhizobium/Agrobacterium group]|uniref:Na+/H+ antiporter n=1 Tax=Rhizobium/Agrobacterium group TaxID=227290 RepID=UPI0015735D51|nr:MULTISPECIES: Na+/H+ antiporter [Rhizobium/Agrobacterium group]MBD8663939.1 Na+/H+ antiporter [Rhizobium sp. CFBP 8752]NSY16476.1 Na+/H+ antiporter [Neorhizobium sp. AL 9.2.2]